VAIVLNVLLVDYALEGNYSVAVSNIYNSTLWWMSVLGILPEMLYSYHYFLPC